MNKLVSELTDGDFYLMLFNIWANNLEKNGELYRYDEEFFRCYTTLKPKRPFHLMFYAFVGGVDMADEMYGILREGEKE